MSFQGCQFISILEKNSFFKMKKILFILFFLSTIFFCFSNNNITIYPQDNISNNGVYETFYEDGQLKSKGTYIKGKKEGLHKWWYSNGSLEREGYYLNGKKDGVYRWWYLSGQLYIKGEYKEGVLLDKNICYDKRGNIIKCKQL